MTKITLNDVGSLINATTAEANINSNFGVVETAFDNTLSRDGTVPNTMGAPLDMNSQQVLNLPAPVNANSPLRLQDLSDFIGGGTISNIPVGGTTGQVLGKNSNTNYDTGWRNSVTSVGLSAPSDFTITNSPVTSTGTLTAAWAVTPTGTGAVVRATSPTLVTPVLGTPTSGNMINCNLPLGSVTGLATNVAGFLSAASSANLATALTDETGSGLAVFNTSPTLVTPILGTPTSGTLTNCTLPVTGVSGLGTGVGTFLATPTSANLASAITNETGTGALVFATSPALVTPTGIVKGDVGLGNVDNTSDVTKYAATKTLTNTTYDTAGTGNSFSINGVAATANTGTGSVVRATSPTLVTPVLGAATATTINGATLDNTAWTTYTPTISSTAGSLASTLTTMSGPATGRYKQIGKTVICQINCGQVTVVGTASGNVIATAPVAASAAQIYVGASIESNLTGRSGGASIGAVGASSIACRQADTTTYWTLNYNVYITITYEAA